LPVGRPMGFTGAVGKFQITANANLNHVKTNDAITFTVEVSGKGNLKLIDNVQSNFPPVFDVFDPIRKAQLDKSNSGKSGKISFEYTIIPRHAGSYTIPSFTLVYFDPESQHYNSISTQTFNIIVDKGEGDSTMVMTGNLTKEDIELLGSDIRFIETRTILRPRSNFIFGSSWFFAIYILLIATFITVLMVRRERIRRSADMVSYRNRRAGRVANKRLRTAKQLLREGKTKEFYDELEQALWKYLADKLKIPFSELSKDRANDAFKSRSVSDELTQEFFILVQSCEFARYAPGGLDSEMSELLGQSASILNKLDQIL
jgi:hypothetical protein